MQYGIFYLSPVYTPTVPGVMRVPVLVNIVFTIHKRGRWDNTTLVPVFVKKVGNRFVRLECPTQIYTGTGIWCSTDSKYLPVGVYRMD